MEQNIEDTVRFTGADLQWKEEDFGHGRIESRHCYLYKDLSFIENASHWKSLSAVVKIESTRYIKSTAKEEKQTRFYITGSQACAEVTGKAVRSHWGIENQLHWQLDENPISKNPFFSSSYITALDVSFLVAFSSFSSLINSAYIAGGLPS